MAQDTQEKIGPFIAQLRKEQGMTQRALAEQLLITDKAVSKWERGLSCPDISLLPALAEIFGVTTSELLNGQRGEASAQAVESEVERALEYAGTTVTSRVRAFRRVGAALLSLLLFLGGAVCVICDLALSGGLTWSPIPAVSILLAWVTLFPTVKWGGKGVAGSLAALTVGIFPFLFALDRLIPGGWPVFSMGAPIAAASAVYLWAVFFVFRRWKARKLFAGVLALLLMLPLDICINAILAEPLIDRWDLLAFAILAVVAVGLFLRERAVKAR